MGVRCVEHHREKNMSQDGKYTFSWDLLGDVRKGRRNLGPTTRIEVYRLMQFCFRDVMEKAYGAEGADEVFYNAGKLAGEHFYRNVLGGVSEYHSFIKHLQNSLKEMGIGILRVEKSDFEAGEFVITVSEDLDCSGLPDVGYEICKYDEGFIAALLESFSGKKFMVREIDCWSSGDRTCRFLAKVI
jgi:predicted hydrocarbon binding protein